MTEPSKEALIAARKIRNKAIEQVSVLSSDTIALIIDHELQEAITLACHAHKEKQELLIAFIRRLGAKDPVLESEVKNQFRLWNLPYEPVNK